jgi:hypothetical protein
MTPNDTSEPGQVPAPPPPKGLLHLIMGQRFLVVSLVVVLFLGLLFAWGAGRGDSTAAKPADSAAQVSDSPSQIKTLSGRAARASTL